MTREEAIDELSVIYERLSHPEDCANGVYSFADGDYLEAIDMAIEALSEPSKVDFRTDKSANISTKVKSDLISRADAIEAFNGANLYQYALPDKAAAEILESLPSAVAESKVIRSKTLMPTKDFKEWAKRVREVNSNAIVIPCDAEVVSAAAVQGWIPLSHDGLGTNFPYERDGEWVIVTDGKNISVERIKKDAYDHFYPNGRWFELNDVIAWMPLPTPYKGGGDE